MLAVGLNAEILEQVLVKVNGEIITQTEFQRIQLSALRELPNPPDPARTSDAELAKIFAQVTPQAIVTDDRRNAPDAAGERAGHVCH